MSFYLTERMRDALVLLADEGSQPIGLTVDGLLVLSSKKV
jgi:hypothetical protein